MKKCTKHLSKIYYHSYQFCTNNKSLRNCSFFLFFFFWANLYLFFFFFNNSKYTVSMSHVCALIRVFHKLATDITTVSRFPTRFFSLITFQDYVRQLSIFIVLVVFHRSHRRKIKKQNLFSQ